MDTGSGADASGCGGVATGNAASTGGGVGGIFALSDAVGIVAKDTTLGGACTPVFMCVSLLLRREYVSTITVSRRCSRMRSG